MPGIILQQEQAYVSTRDKLFAYLMSNQSTQEVKKERYLIKTRQNKVQFFGKFCLHCDDFWHSRVHYERK